MPAKIEPLIFELSRPGRHGTDFAPVSLPHVPAGLCRKIPAQLPQVSELQLVRHYTHLSNMNFCIDSEFYPLGSCTMKYNPRINEDMARLPGFAAAHPLQPEALSQGVLQLMFELEQMLCEITGMDAFTLQPSGGAHGELLGIMMIHAYHAKKGNPRRKIIVPDSSHGTNPSSAHIAGYQVLTVKSDAQGDIDVQELAKQMDEEVAAVMLTNPNTLGLFEREIGKVAQIVHAKGGLLYGDGANLNALMGLARPGDMGFDVMHVNLHKTFSTPHGGGGPGAGPVGVKKGLIPYLPVPRIVKEGDRLAFKTDYPDTVGKIRSFWGSVGMLVRAYTYMRAHGAEGLAKISRLAIINANYIKEKLKGSYKLAYGRTCMHECVLTAEKQKAQGVNATDIAKGLLDRGFHAPTVYFPLVVPEALMIEPTECETKQTLDEFIEAMLDIARQAGSDPAALKAAPVTTPITRLDEVKAARELNLRYRAKATQALKKTLTENCCVL